MECHGVRVSLLVVENSPRCAYQYPQNIFGDAKDIPGVSEDKCAGRDDIAVVLGVLLGDVRDSCKQVNVSGVRVECMRIPYQAARGSATCLTNRQLRLICYIVEAQANLITSIRSAVMYGIESSSPISGRRL